MPPRSRSIFIRRIFLSDGESSSQDSGDYKVPERKNDSTVNQPIIKDGIFLEFTCTCSEPDVAKLLVCALYFPPVSSEYAKPNSFQDLEDTLLNLSDGNAVIVGDVNGRTGSLKEYVPGEDNNISEDVSMEDKIEMYGITKDRASMDKLTNKYGHSLIDFCIGQGLLIANGRVGADQRIGKLTCKDASVVDYVIASPSVFPIISAFEVLDFDNCLSDVH